MAGHSKWHNIQRRKGKQDALRGQLFTRLSRDIYHAAKEGGGNLDTNFRLKVAIDRGKAANLPADSITRTIAKATGALEGQTFEEILYEGFGPNGVAVLIEIVTDNRNRTAADVRHIFKKRGGNLGESGSVGWMFERQGRFVISKEESNLSFDGLFMLAVDAGANDVQDAEDEYVVTTAVEQFNEVRRRLEEAGVELDEAELVYEATTPMDVSPDDANLILDLIEVLEAHDDVQSVYTNAHFPENVE